MLRSDAATTWLEQAISQRMYVAKAKGKRLKRPAPGRVPMLLPIGLEADFEAYISSLLKRIAAAGEPWVPAEGERLDATAPPGWERSMAAMREAQRKIMEEQSGNVYAMVAKFGQSTAEWNRKQWTKQLKPYVGVDLYPPGDPLVKQTVEAWSKENLSRIKSLGSQQIEALNETMMAATRAGTNMRDIRKELQRTNATFTKWRAELLARDQMGKLNGSLTRTRSTAAGISKYIWRGILDQRERASHAVLEGKSRSWNEGGITPGEEILCRCTSEPELDDIWTKCEEDVYGEPPVQATPSSTLGQPVAKPTPAPPPVVAPPNPKIVPKPPVTPVAKPTKVPVAKPSKERRMPVPKAPAPKPVKPAKPELSIAEKVKSLMDARDKVWKSLKASKTFFEGNLWKKSALRIERQLASLGVEGLVPKGFETKSKVGQALSEMHWNHTPEWQRAAIRRALPMVSEFETVGTRGFYDPNTRKINLGGSGLGSRAEQTFRHEFGHHMDWAMNEQGGIFRSEAHLGKLEANVRKWDSADFYKKSSIADEQWTSAHTKTMAETIGVTPEELEKFIGGAWGGGTYSQRVGWAFKPLLEGSPEEFCNRYGRIRRDAMRGSLKVEPKLSKSSSQLHDMLEASSKGAFGSGHGAQYFADDVNRMTEMFAQFTSLSSDKETKIWTYIMKKLWPDVYEAFKADTINFGKVL